MALYLIIFFLLSLCSFAEIFGLKRRDSLMLFLLWSVLFFVMSFIRWETGTDWEPYEGFFNWCGDWAAHTEYETGFFFLNTFVKQFTDNYTVMLFVEGAIISLFTTLAIKRFSIYPLTSLLIIFAILLANIMFVRQAMATAILFYSATYIIDHRKLPFLLTVFLAFLIHRSSIIFLLAWPVFHLKWSLTKMTISLLIAVALSSVIGTLMMTISGLFGSIIQTKIDLYLGEGSQNNTFGAGFSMAQIIIKGLINKAFLFIIGAYVISHSDELKYPNLRGFMNLYWFGAIIYFMAIPISLGLARFSYAFDIFQIVLIPYLFVLIKDRWLKSSLFLIIGIYLLMRLYVYITNFETYYIPFKTFLDA